MNMKTRIFLLLTTITLIGCNDKMKILPGTYEAAAMGGTHPVKQDSSYSYKASFAKSTIKLMDLPNGTQRALLSTTLDISDGNWLEEGYFDGHGNFVIGIFDEETLEQKNDTCFYKVKEGYLLLEDKKKVLLLSDFSRRFNEKFKPSEAGYITVYLFKINQ